MEQKPENPWKCFRGSFRTGDSFHGSTSVEAFFRGSGRFRKKFRESFRGCDFRGRFRENVFFFSVEASMSSMEVVNAEALMTFHARNKYRGRQIPSCR